MDEELNIGRKVQQFRKQSGLSLRELAARVELSPSMLSQIENDAVNPSINTLKNIAQALHVPLFRFFKEDEPQPERLIVRRGENRIIGHPGEEVLYKLLTPTADCSIEFCLMEIPPHTASSDIDREHTGEEVKAAVALSALLILLAIVLVKGVISPIGTPQDTGVSKPLPSAMLTGYLTGDLTVG